MGGDALQ